MPFTPGKLKLANSWEPIKARSDINFQLLNLWRITSDIQTIISDIIQFNRLQFTDIKEMETDTNFMFSSKEKVMKPSAVSGVKKNLSYWNKYSEQPSLRFLLLQNHSLWLIYTMSNLNHRCTLVALRVDFFLSPTDGSIRFLNVGLLWNKYNSLFYIKIGGTWIVGTSQLIGLLALVLILTLPRIEWIEFEWSWMILLVYLNLEFSHARDLFKEVLVRTSLCG